MPLHERRTALVKIRSSWGNRIFCIRAIGKFATALKSLGPTMCFYHGLQQQLDNRGMKIAAHQHLGGGPDERHVLGRNDSVYIKHTFWQHQSSEVRENSSERLRHWKAQELNVGVFQK